MKPMFTAVVGSILRHLLTLAAGYFVSQGIWTEAEAASYVAGIVLALVGLLWSLYEKYAQQADPTA